MSRASKRNAEEAALRAKRLRAALAAGAVALAALAGAGIWLARRPEAPPEKFEMPSAASDFQPTVQNKTPAPAEAPEGMVWIPGGEFSMGGADPTSLERGGHDSMPEDRKSVV